MACSSVAPLPVAFLLFLVFVGRSASALSNDYYANTCPNVESIVRSSMRGIFAGDITAPAAMIRLLFHDCQVDGCDASIMLENSPGASIELKSPLNLGVRRLNAINSVKARLEGVCPQTVSCADIIALAARDAVALNGGPDISIPLGRLDGFAASEASATSALPPATISVSNTISLFGAMGMNVEESVAMLGSHTVGVAHCNNFANRLYPRVDSDLSFLFATTLLGRCPLRSPLNLVATLDTSFLRFDNSYFRNALNHRGLLTIDSELGRDPRTRPIVENFASDQNAFFNAFASGFVKLASFGVLSGSGGEVRLDCSAINNS